MQPFQTMNAPRNQYVSDVSGADFSAQLGHVTANGQLTIEFFYAQIRIEDPLDPGTNGTYKTVLCVRKRPHGDRLTQAVRFITERQAQELFPREYAYFKQNQAVPTDGTPLHELPGLSQSQIAILVVHNIRCVEDLVGMHVDQVGQIGMEARSAHAIAKKWVDAKAANGDLIRDAARDAAQNAELQRLRDSDARSAALIAQMQAQLDVLTRMGLQAGSATPTASAAGSQSVTVVDADDLPDVQTTLFTGAQIVTGNDDLDGPSQPAPEALPGLNRKKG